MQAKIQLSKTNQTENVFKTQSKVYEISQRSLQKTNRKRNTSGVFSFIVEFSFLLEFPKENQTRKKEHFIASSCVNENVLHNASL